MQVTPGRDGLVPGTRQEVYRFEGIVPVTVRLGPDGLVYLAVFPSKIVKVAPKQLGHCPAR
jgi:hypothetical protein